MEGQPPERMPAGLRLERITTASDVVVLVHGEIDIASADRMRDELVDAASAKPDHVTVDVRGVSFIDSSGLSALVEARDLTSRLTTLRLAGVDPHLRRLLEISGLVDEFEILDH